MPESQCGFRKGRSCSDMIFTVRQLVEKTIEHGAKLFLVFVDLSKTYDSVPRAALWHALHKLGIPALVIDIICSFHEGMKAKVRVNGKLTEVISVENGLQQGCNCNQLFNLFAASCKSDGPLQLLVWKEWGLHYSTSTMGSCSPGKLAKDRVLDSQFADDAVLFANTRTGAQQALRLYQEVAGAFGLKVNLQMTKLMGVGPGIEDKEIAPITMGNNVVECVEDFTYLGLSITPNARIDAEVDRVLWCMLFDMLFLKTGASISDMSIWPGCLTTASRSSLFLGGTLGGGG